MSARLAPDSTTSLKVEYRSSRREIWDWYWWSWRQPKGLWRFHAGIAIVAFAAVLIVRWQHGVTAADLGWAAAAALGCVVWLPLWPLLRFKPQVRELQIDPQGIRTVIGKLKGDKRWDEIAAIHEHNGAIVIAGTSMNAFIVPARAFATEEARIRFLDSARHWHRRQSAGNA